MLGCGSLQPMTQSSTSEQFRSDPHTFPRRGFDSRRGRRGYDSGRGRDGPRRGTDGGFESRVEVSERDVSLPSSDGVLVREDQVNEQQQSVSGDVRVESRGGYENSSDVRGGSRRSRSGGQFRGRDNANWRRVNEPVSKSDSNEQLSEGRSSLKVPNSGHSRHVGSGQEKERRMDVGRQRDVAEKINIPQLVQELEVKLSTGKIECMICYDNVGRNAPVWSCASCYSIFHMPCVRKWARAPTSSDVSVSATGNGEANWRCPGCQAVQMSAANELQYYCFCGQVREPALDYYITPHSCGGPCRKPLDKSKNGYCKHTCTLQCHPGPCPPCTALAPPQPCPCGKSITTRRCSEQGKDARSCGQQCGRPLSCGRHECPQTCHEGACEPCSVLFEARCFCGRLEEGLQCWQVEPPGKINVEAGVFSCEMQCPKMLPCGNHMCGNKCHPGACGDCELSPSVVRTCPCGKKNLAELQDAGSERQSCTDPIPTCQQMCGKFVTCKKHPCRSPCHSGPCPPCDVVVDQKCQCGASTRRAVCHFTRRAEPKDDASGTAAEGNDGGLFLCDRKCGKMRSCGRHRCNDR
jgi:transcriptional repressor NF-X1